MSFLDFTRIREQIPESNTVWIALENWAKEHPQRTTVPVVELIDALTHQVELDVLLQAIEDLVAKGLAKRSFRVVDPSQRIILEKPYSSRQEVPPQVLNNWDHWVEVKPKDIAMVLENPSSHVGVQHN
jgi:hypothetical protein